MADNPKCTPFPPVVDGGSKRYSLPDLQVEPTAGYWTTGPCTVPCVVRMSELTALTDDPTNGEFYFPPYPSDQVKVDAEVAELEQLALDRDAALPAGTISEFLLRRPQPLGVVFNLTRKQKELKKLDDQCELDLSPAGQDEPAVIQTGRELARWFEAETPGVGHRHALNCLILDCNLSPPRQALIWAALDITIYSAMLAAWHYKWASDRPCTVYRPRPVELKSGISVLYDKEVNNTGSGDGALRTSPLPSPGTPRHPSYPSGHSTVGGAASEILSFFFPDHKPEIDKIAENGGEARLWAGIHYRSDHVQGVKLGRSVAKMVISQLQSDGVPPPPAVLPAPAPNQPPPTKEQLRADSYKARRGCRKAGKPWPCPQPAAAARRATRQSVQKGAS